MRTISYDYFCNISVKLEKFVTENPKVLSSPGKLQNKLHLASNNCKELHKIARLYWSGCVPLRRLVLSIIVVKFWKDNAIFENCMGDCAVYQYMVARYEPHLPYARADIYTKAKSLEKFMFDTWENLDTEKCSGTDVLKQSTTL